MITPHVSINSVDLSLKLTGKIQVNAQEGQARTAQFSINPDAGTLNPYSYLGQAVTIDVDSGSGSVRLFTGIVHLPKYNISTGLIDFTCTDNLQKLFETIDITATTSAIDALIPGYWDAAIFGAIPDSWTYANQRISAYAGSFDLSPYAVLRTTAWLAKVTPDFTFTDATILEKSLDISLAEQRYITNSVVVNFSSRFERLWQRELTASWSSGITAGTFYTWLTATFQLPTKTMLKNAFSSWVLKSIHFDDLPPSGLYTGILGVDPRGWVLNDLGREQALGCTAWLANCWRQTITDIYTVTLNAPASIAANGLVQTNQNFSISGADAAISAELTSASGWTSSGWTGSWATGWTHTVGNTSALSATLTAVAATNYQITWSIILRSAGSVTLQFGDWSRSSVTADGAAAPYSTTTGNLIITPSSDFDGEIAISIKSVIDTTHFSDFKSYAAPIAGAVLVGSGNYIYTNESASLSNAYLTAVNQAKVKILASHRSNTLSFAVPINSALDTIHTININHPKLQAQGKVLSLQHSIDIDAGNAITTVNLALYLPNVASQTDTALTLPSSPYTDPTGMSATWPVLSTHLSLFGAPAEDPTWLGWVANYDGSTGPYYTPRFSVGYPTITDTEPVEYNNQTAVSVAIPQDYLVIIK